MYVYIHGTYKQNAALTRPSRANVAGRRRRDSRVKLSCHLARGACSGACLEAALVEGGRPVYMNAGMCMLLCTGVSVTRGMTVCMLVDMHVYMYAFETCMPVNIYVYTCIYMNTHTHTHTHTHTYVNTLSTGKKSWQTYVKNHLATLECHSYVVLIS